jgi:hypothetical protein
MTKKQVTIAVVSTIAGLLTAFLIARGKKGKTTSVIPLNQPEVVSIPITKSGEKASFVDSELGMVAAITSNITANADGTTTTQNKCKKD